MKRIETFLAAATAVTALAWGQSACAAGTLAGTLIQNTASITFWNGTGTTTLQTNTNTIKVDQVTGVTVTALTSAPVAVGGGNAVLVYQVTNIGNGADSFDLTAAPNVTGNAFNAVLQTVAIDSNGNGTYDPAADATVANGAAGPVLTPDTSAKVFVIVAAPANANDTQTSQVRLTATSVTASGTPGALFAGKGVGGVDVVVGASGATGNALASLTANLANVTLTKSATIADPYGGANPVSGAIVTYAIIAHTAGSGTATNLQVNDAFPAGTTYQPGTLTLGGATLSDAADSDAGFASATGITVQLGNVAGGSADKTITFKVKIN